MLVSFILFFVLGLGFGFAMRFPFGFSALLVPLLLGVITMAVNGSDGTVVARLLTALVVTAVGVVLGFVIQRASGERANA